MKCVWVVYVYCCVGGKSDDVRALTQAHQLITQPSRPATNKTQQPRIPPPRWTVERSEEEDGGWRERWMELELMDEGLS